MWVNVLDNAVKLSSKFGRLEVSLTEVINAVIFRVQDYGSGMEEESRTHMFEKFYQEDKSIATDGNGLGLAVVKKIVVLHGGEITVESAPWEGTTIIITLPKVHHS